MDHIKHETREIMTKNMGGKDRKPLKVGDRIREKNGWSENLGKYWYNHSSK